MQEIHHFFHSLFSPTLDFRVRLFNILALGGTVISLIMAFLSLGTGSWRNVLINIMLVGMLPWQKEIQCAENGMRPDTVPYIG